MADEVAAGFAVQGVVADRLMHLVVAVDAYRQEHGAWPAGVDALNRYARAEDDLAFDAGDYERLEFATGAADDLRVRFAFEPFRETVGRRRRDRYRLDVRAAAGRIELDPTSDDRTHVHIVLDVLTYAAGRDASVEGDLSGAEIEFDLEPEAEPAD